MLEDDGMVSNVKCRCDESSGSLLDLLYTPRKLTWNLKKAFWKRKNINTLPIVGFHASFPGCIFFIHMHYFQDLNGIAWDQQLGVVMLETCRWSTACLKSVGVESSGSFGRLPMNMIHFDWGSFRECTILRHNPVVHDLYADRIR